MDRTARIVQLHHAFLARREGLTIARIMEMGDCARPTAYRDLEFLRDQLGAPVQHDGAAPRTWRYALSPGGEFQLPGMWLGADELYGLRMAQQVFQQSGAEGLEDRVGKLLPRVQKMLASHAHELRRLRIVRTRGRRMDPIVFRNAAQATFERCQLAFDYVARSSLQDRRRLTSPQSLTHYRDNWYLDAWDHDSAALRSFALDRMRQPQLLDRAALDLPDAELETHQQAGYGIFSGPILGTATIRFTPLAARWVADEHWHPEQTARPLPDGSLELRVPYANPRELLMDVLRHGADAEILAPPTLRKEMEGMLREALGRYGE